jgi:hypothetical protein
LTRTLYGRVGEKTGKPILFGSFYRYLLSAYCTGFAPDAEEIAVNKTDRNPFPGRAGVPERV